MLDDYSTKFRFKAPKPFLSEWTHSTVTSYWGDMANFWNFFNHNDKPQTGSWVEVSKCQVWTLQGGIKTFDGYDFDAGIIVPSTIVDSGTFCFDTINIILEFAFAVPEFRVLARRSLIEEMPIAYFVPRGIAESEQLACSVDAFVIDGIAALDWLMSYNIQPHNVTVDAKGAASQIAPIVANYFALRDQFINLKLEEKPQDIQLTEVPHWTRRIPTMQDMFPEDVFMPESEYPKNRFVYSFNSQYTNEWPKGGKWISGMRSLHVPAAMAWMPKAATAYEQYQQKKRLANKEDRESIPVRRNL